MLKYLFCIIIGIILYILINSIEKFNIGGLRATFEYNPNTQTWERTIYATQTDIDNELTRELEDTDYQTVLDYNVDLAPAPQDNTVFYIGDTNDESGTTMDAIYTQLGRLITEHNRQDEERVKNEGGEANEIPLRNSPVIGTCFTEALPAYPFGLYEPDNPDTQDHPEEGIPPECWIDFGYYQELQPGTPELLFEKLVEVSRLFDRPKGLCASIVSTEQRLALALAQQTNTYLSDDLMEMVGRMVGRQVQSDLSNPNIRDLLLPRFTRMYLEWQTRFTRDMMDQFNRDIQNAFTEAEQGNNAYLRELTTDLNFELDYDFTGINMVVLRQEIESRLFGFRLTDAHRNYVERMFIFELIIDNLLRNLSLRNIDIDFLKVNIRYYLVESMLEMLDRTIVELTLTEYLNNIVLLALLFVFNYLMYVTNIVTDSGNFELTNINTPEMMLTPFYSSFLNIFKHNFANIPPQLQILFTYNINSNNINFELLDFINICIFLKSKDLLKIENLLTLFFNYSNEMSLDDILLNFGFTEVEMHQMDMLNHIDITSDNILLLLLEVIQILFGETGLDFDR
ncbi:hypothetical protein N8569_00490 [bacterium]|nr:hypothetical protein [bacterium]